MGIGVAVFLLVYCGMPAEISAIKEKVDICCYTRTDRELYNVVHAMWHIASGVGPVLSTWLFMNLSEAATSTSEQCSQRTLLGITPLYCGNFVMGSQYYLDESLRFPVVPVAALLLSTAVNVFGNTIGIMPLD
jgi:hypothetical protein